MSIASLVARRLSRVLAVVVVVATLAWLLAEAAPGSAGERAARAAGVLPPDDSSVPRDLRRELIDRVAEEHDLKRSLPARVGSYVVGLARLDMGRSWRDGEAVTEVIGRAAAPTLTLLFASLVVALGCGLVAGAASARRPGAGIDLVLGGAAAVALALPPVWVAIAVLRTFATGEPWSFLPASGLDSAASAVLPVLVLALVPTFVIARHARAALIHASESPWATAALARGASRARVVWVHAVRSALPALLPLAVVTTAYLIGATVVIEEVFGIHGLGATLIDASRRGDAPVVVGVSVLAGAVLAVSSAVVDVLQRMLDPREGMA